MSVFRSVATVFGFAILSVVNGCAADAGADDIEDVEDDPNVSEEALTATPNQQKAILAGLRVRVTKDFDDVLSLRDRKLVFIVRTEEGRIQTNGQKAFVSAVFVKRNAAGVDARLTREDYKRSVHELRINEGAFDCR